jgi:hypothetical protein
MKKIIFIFLILFCSTQTLAVIQISHQEALDIGMKIWKNESSKRVDLLVTWNPGEEFASLGIGHFIWHPKKRHSHFRDTFPELITYMKRAGVKLPYWLRGNKVPPCPWPNRAAFLRAKHSKKARDLQALMLNTIPIQAQFIASKTETTLFRILKKTHPKEHNKLKKNFYALAGTPKGVYVLADYLNFKGEGLGSHTQYNREGWGLLQVLRLMSYAPRHAKPNEAFAWAANRLLIRRVKNSPRHRNEKRWLPGWKKRLLTYL